MPLSESPITCRVALGPLVALAAVLALAACGQPRPHSAPSAAPSSSAVQTPGPAGPMVKVPAGVSVPLVVPGRLTVCSLLSGPPYGSKDSVQSNKAVGLDMDVLELVAERLSAVELVVTANPVQVFNGQALNAKQCDIATDFADNAGLAPAVDVTDPYIKSDMALLTTADAKYRSLDSLQGKRIAVVKSSPESGFLADYNAKHGNGIQVMPLGDVGLAGAMVKAGQADATLLESGLAYYDANQGRGLKVAADYGDLHGRAFGVRKGNAVLRDQVNAALIDAAGNGQYAKAYWTWFGKQAAWMPGR